MDSPGFHHSRPTGEGVETGIAPSWISGEPEYPSYDPRHEGRADVDLSATRQLSAAELDTLPYGLIVVDRDGRVLFFNDTESRFVGLERSQVVGKNFFRDIAPCTRVRAFEGRFRDFVHVDQGYGVETFDFAFRFPHSLQTVTIYITAGRRRGTFNIALVRRTVERS